MQKGRPESASWDQAPRATLTSTSGGSIDTDVKALTVIPRGPSGPSKVTTITPVGNRARHDRSDRSVLRFVVIVTPDMIG
jgi:hypothetical protein